MSDPSGHPHGRGGHGAPGGERSRRTEAGLALAALGIVYGDIGTSPLYAIRETFEGHGHTIAVNADNILGALSLIFWSLIIIISIKYLVFVMRADNDGEGGILALTSLISGHGDASGVRRRRWTLILLGVFGTALLYGDGMITPAISVLAAVEGTKEVASGLSHFVVPISLAILVGLFAIQSRGTAKIGRLFGPIMLVWFSTLGGLGLIHLLKTPEVLRAVNPTYAAEFFVHNGSHGFLAMGSVFLVVTGGEALYADMGHFGRRPIQYGWFGLVLPALMLNYFGQGALLMREPDAITHPFFQMAPGWALVPLVVLATVATVIASQALISGVFSLTQQAVQLGYSPRVRVTHTSASAIGQIYLPSVNWGLMVACLALVVGFGSSAALASAYGLAVTSTMVITTLLFYLVLRERFGWSTARAVTLCSGFLVIDLAFFGANVVKIPSGGWFPLVIAALVFTVMTTWRTGRRLVGERIRRGFVGLDEFVDGSLTGLHPPERVAGTAIYLFSSPELAPPAMIANVRHNRVLHERTIVLSVITDHVPRVTPDNRSEITRHGHGVLSVRLHYGFMEEPHIMTGLTEGRVGDLMIDGAAATYFLGAETIRVTHAQGMAVWREHLFALMSRNATPAATYFGLAPEQTVTLGIQVDL